MCVLCICVFMNGYCKLYFDRTVAECRQLLFRGRFMVKKHLSGGCNYWHYGSTSAVRSCFQPRRIGLRLGSKAAVLDRLYSLYYQQILATYTEYFRDLPRPI